MNKIPSALALGVRRGLLEIRQFSRQRESVIFTLLFPLMLLAIFGSIFKNNLAPGVTFSQYFAAGMVASALVNTGFQQLAIMIPLERDFGTLKRLRGMPMPISSYFIGKSILVFASMVLQIILLLLGGTLFFGLNLPTDPMKWFTFTWLILLGSACSTALGIAFAGEKFCVDVGLSHRGLHVWLAGTLLPASLQLVCNTAASTYLIFHQGWEFLNDHGKQQCHPWSSSSFDALNCDLRSVSPKSNL